LRREDAQRKSERRLGEPAILKDITVSVMEVSNATNAEASTVQAKRHSELLERVGLAAGRATGET
jgi:hypothetical protein